MNLLIRDKEGNLSAANNYVMGNHYITIFDLLKRKRVKGNE